MKNKNLFSFIGIFSVLLLSLSLASAVDPVDCLDITSVSVPAYAVDGSVVDFTFNVTHAGGACADRTNVELTFTATKTGTFTAIPLFNIASGDAPKTINGKLDLNVLQTGNLVITVNQDSDQGVDDSEDLPAVTVTNFCEQGNKGDLEIKGLDINNIDGDDAEWAPLDEIQIEVDIKNTGDDRISKINVEVKILDESGSDVTDDFDLDDDVVELGSISDSDTDTATFAISELPADLEDGTYKLYIKAYSKGNEDIQCVDFSTSEFNQDSYHEFDIVRDEDEAVIIKDFVSSMSVNQGETPELTYQIYNVGTEDQEDVLIVIKSTELGINQREHISNLDVGEKKEVSFSVNIPSTANPKEYDINLMIYFTYDDGDVLSESSYDADSSDIDEDYTLRLAVQGQQVSAEPEITATLLSDAKINENLVVQVSVTNNGDNSENFVLTTQGVESWAEVVDVSPQILTIGSDSTKQATITLKPTKAGTQTFDIVLIYSGKEATQAVSVTIEKQEGFLTGAFAGLGLGNTGIYLIAGIFLVLIVIILVLIVKVAKSPKSSSEF